MSPAEELRQNALSKIQSARALLSAEKYDEAAYLAGYGVEFALKARFCTRNKLTKFPNTLKEAKAMGVGDVWGHDLRALLKLSDGHQIAQNSMFHIDWAKAMDWDSQQRYEPLGTTNKTRAEAQVQETEKLFIELALFEIVEALVTIEIEVSSTRGPFCLFALARGETRQDGWEILMSAWWLSSKETLIEIADKAKSRLDYDLCSSLGNWWMRHPTDILIRRFNSMPSTEHTARFVTAGNYIIDRDMPPAFIITNRRVPAPKTDSYPVE
jgi:hypothetical protein